MNILHYTIGLPPRRSGGSVQYAHDLIVEQQRQGHNVMVLTCGDTLLRGRRCTIKKNPSRCDITSYRLTNPLTPTLIYGTRDPRQQHRDIKIDTAAITRLITGNKIEILHLHTLQGLHRDIVELFKRQGVKIVYTTHDFHGICPRYNLIDLYGNLCDKVDSGKCARCNANEPGDTFLRLANSTLYQRFKRLNFISRLKKKHAPRQTYRPTPSATGEIQENALVYSHETSAAATQEETRAAAIQEVTSAAAIQEYGDLIDYYKGYFDLIDQFHFNSTQTRDRFTHFLGKRPGEVIEVVTAGIADKRLPLDTKAHHSNKIPQSPSTRDSNERPTASDSNGPRTVKLCYIGSLNTYKGFQNLKKAIIQLHDQGIDNLHLDVYAGTGESTDPDCRAIHYHLPYDYRRVDDIMYHTDAVVVPSVWYETFSLVTLEALSHGRPAIVSSHVGARDIVARYSPQFIYDTTDQLTALLATIARDPSVLDDINRRILSTPWQYDIASHAARITALYRR